MKTIARMALRPGMELAEDVQNNSGKLLYTAHSIVDDAMIERLARHQIMIVSIMEKVDYATTYFEKIRLSDGFSNFVKVYETVFPRFKEIMNNLVDNGTPVDTNELMDIYHKLVDPVGSNRLVLDYLYNMMSSEDELTHAHSLNSALIAGVFADWLAMHADEKEILIMCAFFYDIGKLKLPPSLLWKPGKLTDLEFERIKTHTMIGFNIVKDHDYLDSHVIKSILMHHERCDGQGYPSHLKMQQIDTYAKHISIIDAYEAMTSPRSYRESMTPLQVVERFEKSGMLQYDYDILNQIMKKIADTQIGLTVKLSDDSMWEVFLVNQLRYSRPVLKRDTATAGQMEFLDLVKRSDLEIVAVY